MAVAGSPGIPSAGFTIRNRELVQIGPTSNKPSSAVLNAADAAAILIFNPGAVVQMDVRRGTQETMLRLHLLALDIIDGGKRESKVE